ncbi:phage tail protein [Alkalicoccobacillus plakortidis]|uniref:Phage tail protein n=1 Tax=Alkalicoccobacillus plakortidis TaxID=444060 RepID=A0ABT0XII1_9BACI|nr:phage tail protein [Alkalicoccobacillus plakortidis]MCM2675570.1 phage tail protein [Alkalicoccobacillus plakortidis]
MSWDGIEFNGLHSYRDLGLTIESRNLGKPSKIKKMERIPYSNIEYDFSSLYGEQEWTERELTYTFNIAGKKARHYFQELETQLLNWLQAPFRKLPLKDDTLSDFYFLAESVSSAETDFQFVMGKVTVTFTAYSHKIARFPEGHGLWDEINFLWDYFQDTMFKVNGSLDVILQNPGSRKAKPEIKTSASIKIIKDGVTYDIPAGTKSSYDFTLSPGVNRLRILGSAEVSFIYYKEMI